MKQSGWVMSDYIDEMSKYMTCELTPLSIVRLTQEYKDWMASYMKSDHYDGKSRWNEEGFYEEFLAQPSFVYLGEIPNMPGHIVVAGQNGRVYYGFHDDEFEETPQDDI